MYMTKNIKKWINYTFEDIECRTGWDFSKFCKDLKMEIEAQLSTTGLTIVKFSKGYFTISGFIYDRQVVRYVYFSVGDVRDTGIWHDKILVRSAKSDRDFTGGQNHYTSLIGFGVAVKNLIKLSAAA